MTFSNSTWNADIYVQNCTKMSIGYRTINLKETMWNVPLDVLKCPLQIINWRSESLSLILRGVNSCIMYHPSNDDSYSSGHKSETDQTNPETTNGDFENIFLHVDYTSFRVKIRTWLKIFRWKSFLYSCVKSALNRFSKRFRGDIRKIPK